jgi:deoxyribonuclease-4
MINGMLIFATPGSPASTPSPGGTLEGLRRTAELGIRAMEIEWVQSVPRNRTHLQDVGAAAHDLGIVLTVHAPYFVNLNAQDDQKLHMSKQRVLHALSMAEVIGAVSVCVHPAFYLGISPKRTMANVRRSVAEIMREKAKLFPSVNLALETMGKPSQFGTLEEVLALSKEFGIYPCVDAAHLHARTNGNYNTAAHWNAMLDAYARTLGKEALQRMHLHYSGIAYGPKGEKHHLPLTESDANWKEFLKVLKCRGVGGILVCESPLMEKDTLLMQRTFEGLS